MPEQNACCTLGLPQECCRYSLFQDWRFMMLRAGELLVSEQHLTTPCRAAFTFHLPPQRDVTCSNAMCICEAPCRAVSMEKHWPCDQIWASIMTHRLGSSCRAVWHGACAHKTVGIFAQSHSRPHEVAAEIKLLNNTYACNQYRQQPCESILEDAISTWLSRQLHQCCWIATQV